MFRVTIGVTGGIAVYKTCELIRLLVKDQIEVQTIMSRGARRFISPLLLEALSGRPVMTDEAGDRGGASYKHLDLGQKCDLVAIVPATANLIGKMASGIADDELSTMLIAATSPILLAPAMNTGMWNNSIVQRNLATLAGLDQIRVLHPDSGLLACGAEGPGRLPAVTAIYEEIHNLLQGESLRGIRVLITAGPTWEALDPVRMLSNRSTGRMGYELARIARRRGADVTLVSGPVALDSPVGVVVHRVESASQMADLALKFAPACDLVVMAAAVADYRPIESAEQKIKKSADGMTLHLERTTDILATICQTDSGKRPLVVGFCAETTDLLHNARAKLERKGADFIVANLVGPQLGFGDVNNGGYLLDRDGGQIELPQLSKSALAQTIWNELQGHPAFVNLKKESVTG